MVKIRLSLHGNKNKHFYKIIVANSRSPRNGRFIEQIGFFYPNKTQINNKNMILKTDRMLYWIKNGAQITKKTKKIINKIIRSKNKE
ncbi:30S ribosomal protein S16 [Buchnera aphidicola]|uniref:30S ribosomal protein S16 n=1 Tax=Buchnera aphidicola TaxID=9 RepID=UPI0034640A82